MGKLRHTFAFFIMIVLSILLPTAVKATFASQPPQPAVDNGRAWLLAHQNGNGIISISLGKTSGRWADEASFSRQFVPTSWRSGRATLFY